MMDVPRNLRYRESHEWIKVEGKTATVGISDYAQQQLGDLTYVELPEAGDEFSVDDEVAVVESVKAASDVYAPLSGQVTAVNERLDEQPELVNEDPYGDGWLFKLRLEDPAEIDELLSSEQYEELLPQDEDED